MDIGKNIKRIRIKKGLTQLQAAKMCGMLDPQYRRYENAKSNPRASTVERIATALSVPISELYKQPKHPVQYMEKNLKINTENIKSNEYCEPDCEYLSSRHNCKKYKKGLAYSKCSIGGAGPLRACDDIRHRISDR